jgi:hypothetical protein
MTNRNAHCIVMAMRLRMMAMMMMWLTVGVVLR